MKGVIYMRVTRDEYELPVAVADSSAELARMLGVERRSIISAISQEHRGKIRNSVYKRVQVVEDEDE